MSKKIIFYLTIFFIFANYSFAEKTSFVPNIPDLPVPKKFFLIKGTDSVFETREGKIVEASFRGKGEESEITTFYQKTLAELGWQEKMNFLFIRDKEKLRITIKMVKKTVLSNYLVINYSFTSL